jgi:K+-sensing histidine kinase KdpD
MKQGERIPSPEGKKEPGWRRSISDTLLASFSFDFCIVPPLYTFGYSRLEDLLDPLVFLVVAILIGSMAATLRHRTEQARSSERETRLLSEQAQELASFQERQRLALELP